MAGKNPPDSVKQGVDALTPDIPADFMTPERMSKLKQILAGLGGAKGIQAAAEEDDTPGGKGGSGRG